MASDRATLPRASAGPGADLMAVRHSSPPARRLRGGDVSVTCFLFSLVVAILCRDWALMGALALALALAALVYPAGLAPLARRRTWVLLATVVVSAGILAPGPGARLGPLGLSTTGVILGLNMVMRALIIIVAVNGLVSTVPIDRLGDAVERLGLRDLGFAVGVAFNLLPLVQRALLTSWHVLRQRAGLRRPLAAARLLLLAAVGHSLRCADQVALAAEARAYAPGGRAHAHAGLRASMIPLVVVLALAALTLVAVSRGW